MSTNWREMDLMVNAESDPRIRWMEGEVGQARHQSCFCLCGACTEDLLPSTDDPSMTPVS